MSTVAKASKNKAKRFLGYARNDKVTVMSTGAEISQADLSTLLEAAACYKARDVSCRLQRRHLKTIPAMLWQYAAHQASEQLQPNFEADIYKSPHIL